MNSKPTSSHSTGRSTGVFRLGLAAFALLAALARPGAGQDDKSCLKCHDEASYKPEQAGEAPPPFMDPLVVVQSVHGQNGVACAHCHTDAVEVPHPKGMTTDTCVLCHKPEVRQYESSIHGRAHEERITEAATCIDCHGAHDTYARSDRRSRTHPINVDKTCLRCHTSDEMAKRFNFTRDHISADYEQSVHARTIAAGHEEAATCNDCHSAHDILPSKDPKSSVNRANIPSTCGKCHWIVLDQYKQSIHGEQFAAGSSKAPVCNSCHHDHRIMTAGSDVFKLAVLSECGNCHKYLEKTYRLGYHGKVTQLGGLRTARCSDCHGHHRIRQVDDPQSKVSPENRPRTCRKCHPFANENFVSFIPHLEYHDKSHPQTYYTYMFMTFLLVGTLGFFFIHSVLWITRETIEVLRRRRARAGGGMDADGPEIYVERFSLAHRVTHAILFISVIGLALTGLPLRYSESNWAQWVFQWLGGYRAAGALHRFLALLTLVYAGIHFVYLWKRWRQGPRHPFWKTVFGPNSMVPNWTDVRQFFQHVRWFLFLGPHPKFGRWTYCEKFDYWAVFWGVTIIGASGLIMAAMPIVAPLVPGWVFNVALIIHSDEALLATSFLFAIHFFHVHLRPLKFPMDHVIFTGSMPMREMEEERPLELEQLRAEGRLDEIRVAPPTRQRLLFNRIVGFTALAVGLGLIACIIYTEVQKHLGL